MTTDSSGASEDAPTAPTLQELGFVPVPWDGWFHTLGENDAMIRKLRHPETPTWGEQFGPS